jgi:hypothetical protein
MAGSGAWAGVLAIDEQAAAEAEYSNAPVVLDIRAAEC